MQETKENRDECKRLLKLCSNQAFFPVDAEVRKLLVDALLRYAATQDHAQRAIMRWIERDSLSVVNGEERSVAPNMADIIRMCSTVPASATPAPSQPCKECRQTPGWIIRNYTDKHGQEVSSAARCRCGAIPTQVASA